MLDSVKIGVVGGGRMGSLHLSKLGNLKDADLVGVYEANPNRGEELTKTFGVKIINSLEELLFLSDAVIISSPTVTHYFVAKLALESGCHVLIEKPICERVQDALELNEIALKRGLVCQVGFLERYRLKALMAENPITPHCQLELQRLSTSVGREPSIDVVSDLMVHDIDLVLSIMKEDPIQISAKGYNVITDYLDFATARLEFSSGAIANLTASRIASQITRRLRAVNQENYTELDFVTNTTFYVGKANTIPQQKSITIDALEKQAISFIQAIKTNSSPVITAKDGARVIEIADQIKAAIFTNRAQINPAQKVESNLGIREH